MLAIDPMRIAVGGDSAGGSLHRQVVDYRTVELPGTIVIDTPNTYLYFVLGDGKAVRYGIGVGREGFTWSGVKSIERKSEWPDSIPPADMLQRQPYLPRCALRLANLRGRSKGEGNGRLEKADQSKR